MASRWLGTVALFSFLIYPAIAQDNSTASDPPPPADDGSTETVWGVVTLTTFGDRVPLLSSDYSVLTPVGADQLYSAGQTFRYRYITPSSSSSSNRSIPGISKYEINNNQIYNYGLWDVFVGQSAQAFLEGLYPPLNINGPGGTNGASQATLGLLANGSRVAGPLGGIQYPELRLASDDDPLSFQLQGHLNCPAYEAAHDDYFSTTEYMSARSATKNFYTGLASVVTSEVPDYTLDYRSAYELWDYISYGVLHDTATAGSISAGTLREARTLADSLTYDLYGNSTANDGIRVMAGRTLASHVIDMLMINFQSSGNSHKMSNIFISFEPMVSLFNLLGLADYRDVFQAMPDLASSLVFELFSIHPNGAFPSYPQSFGDLQIRVLFSQGPATEGNLNPYPVLGNDRNSLHMSLTDFIERLENMVVPNVQSWCTICNSNAVFCPGVTNGSIGLPEPAKSNGVVITPAVAGVIGGLIALVLVGLALIFAMLVFGVRFRRVRAKRRSELGGFKGSEKLASDADLPAGAMQGAGATIVPAASGHRRIESWELKENGGAPRGHPARRPSFEDDMTTLSQREGVKAVENV